MFEKAIAALEAESQNGTTPLWGFAAFNAVAQVLGVNHPTSGDNGTERTNGLLNKIVNSGYLVAIEEGGKTGYNFVPA